jgi:glycosyltransferase involved in cell wall biosynthesis
VSRRRRWVVIRAGKERRWGGEIRRQMIFERLADRTGARSVETWAQVRRQVEGRPMPSFLERFRPGRALASAEQPPAEVIPWIAGNTDPVAVAIYDDPVAQSRALGTAMAPQLAAELGERKNLAVSTFRWHVVPTASFADLAGLDPARVIVGGNGTMTDLVRPGPWPDVPSIGFVSGAAPGRGIEALIEACRSLRSSQPDLRLYLWLVATTGDGQTYVDGLRSTVHDDPWIQIGPLAYAELGEGLAKATILCIPHPANAYMDVALPVKLFDSMAAGRPLVVTPRPETAAIVRRYGVGVVTSGDGPADLADAIERLLDDHKLRSALGEAARAVAVREFDWRVVGDRIATEILTREESHRP